MEDNNGREKIEFRLEVEYIAKGTFYTGFIKSISTEGLFINTTEIAPPGEIIFIDMYLPNYRHKLKLKGKVMRSYEYSVDDVPPGIEVEFLDLKEHLRQVITQFLSSIKMEKGCEGRVENG